MAVPNVLGMDDPGAQHALAAAGLAAGSITPGNHCRGVAGTVLTQNPGAGVTALRGSPVNLTESPGTDARGNPCVLQ